MKVKDGVILPPILRLYQVAESVYGRRGVDAVITSGMDGNHMVGSLHYKGLALDFRIWNLTDPDDAEDVRAEMQDELGSDYDVVLESDHIHAEFDPS